MTSNNLNHSNKETVYYNFKNIEDKFFFATYTNTALSNVRKILNAITEILNTESNTKQKKEIHDDTYIHEHPIIKILSDKNNKNITLQYSIINLLGRYLPSSLIGSKNPIIIGENLQRNLRYLIGYRNFYSHYLPTISFESVEERLKKEYNKFHKHLKQLKQKAVETSERRLGMEKENNYWFSKATQEKVPIEKIDSYSSFVKEFEKNKNQIDLDNFLFLLSLFLTKKEMTELLNCIKGKKSTLKPAHRWGRNIFLVLNAKHFKTKIVSDDLKQVLSLNIMNDLSRIPYILKDSLNDEGKENLYITSNKELDANSLSEEEDVYEQQVELVRYGNLFPYQLLQFIELNNLVPRMRFHLHLGKVFTVKPYEKKIGNNILNRELTKNLYVHGRLKEYDDSFYEDYIKKQENGITAFKEPLKYYNPKYHFSNNRIGICFNDKTNDIPITDYKEENGKKVFSHKNEISEYIISQNFLPSLAYWMLKTNNPKNIENIFRSFAKGFRKFLEDIINEDILKNESLKEDWKKFLQKEEYQLKPNWIPKKIKRYITEQEKDKKKYALDKIQYFINRAIYFAEGENSNNRESFEGFEHFSFKKGDKATEVAKDIVRFMKVTEKKTGEKTIVEKLSSAEYNALQVNLALKTTTEIHQLYENLDLFKKHPFLKNVNIKIKKGTARTISSYFSEYFKASKKYLITLKKCLEEGEIDLDSKELSFIDFGAFKNSYQDIQSYAKNLLSKNEVKHPIYIPNDLLKDEIIKLHKLELTSEEINTTYAIIHGLERDEQQWFYNEKYRKEISDKTLTYRRDSSFRYHWMVDSILWEILKKNVESNKELSKALKSFTLSNYTEPKHNQEGSNSILSTRVEQKLSFEISKEPKEQVEGKPIVVYVKFKRKLKDLGAYRHMLKDPIIPYILSYYTNHYDDEKNPLEIETLEDELEKYHKRRFQTLKKIFELEEKACNKYLKIYQDHLDKNDGTHINFREFMEEVFKDNPNIQDIIGVRNSLLHNKLYTGIEIESNKEGLKTILVFNNYDNLIENFKKSSSLEKIEKQGCV